MHQRNNRLIKRTHHETPIPEQTELSAAITGLEVDLDSEELELLLASIRLQRK
jgi:hypothetical protein